MRLFFYFERNGQFLIRNSENIIAKIFIAKIFIANDKILGVIFENIKTNGSLKLVVKKKFYSPTYIQIVHILYQFFFY